MAPDNTPNAPTGVSQSAFERQLADAQRVSAADFPATQGKTLQQLADTAKAGQQVGLATSVLVAGENRLAFGLIDAKNRFVYGKSAVYVARSPGSAAQGPYPAPADALLIEGRYRSKQAALEASPIASVYAAQVPFKRPGRYAVLVLTKSDRGLLGATAEVNVRRQAPIPDVGERPPAISTDTIASATAAKGRGGAESAAAILMHPSCGGTNILQIVGCSGPAPANGPTRTRGSRPSNPVAGPTRAGGSARSLRASFG